MKRFAVLFMVLALGISVLGTGAALAAKGTLTVGAKNFTEQYIVGNMMAQLLEDAGFNVNTKFGTGSSITRKGLTTGQTDLYAEYTGTAWAVYLDHADVKINDPVELYKRVKEEDLEKNGIIWLDRSTVNNTYALAARQADIEKYGSSLSELAAYTREHPHEVKFGIDHEFYERADGFFAMADTYDMEVDESDVSTMEVGLTFESIARKQIDVAMVFSTDGKLKKYNLAVLEDDKHFFPVYNICVCVRQEVLDEYPELREILKPISELDNETMQRLNYRVDAEGIPAPIVAQQYLKEQGLID